MSIGFRLSGTFETNSTARKIELLDNLGSLTLGSETLPAIAPTTVPSASPSSSVVEIVATSERELAVVYLECDGGQAIGGRVESLAAGVTSFQIIDGASCAILSQEHEVRGAGLRPFLSPPDGFTPSRRATVTGTTSPPGVVLGPDGTGHISVKETIPELSGFQDWQMTAFGFLDCPTCGSGGWSEVHVLLTRPDGAVGIATLYLRRDRPDIVQMALGYRLDRPASLATVSFPATWEVH
ncbi:MAG TPA: hypothetical protein VL691_17515 [Vicinamibacteria bacterium]|nr:hypothetical protein [Vicinamibacteria bacterium]